MKNGNELRARKLSLAQERRLLKLLLNARALNWGSSRLVFIDPRNSNRVIKLAIGSNAFRQNKREIAIWNSYQDERFARIFEYGRFCLVMERIYEEYGDFMSDSIEAARTIQWLHDEFGYTEDNEQVGRTSENLWKSFDYGFDPALNSRMQCGEADSIPNAEVSTYIQEARNLLLEKLPISKIDHFLFRE